MFCSRIHSQPDGFIAHHVLHNKEAEKKKKNVQSRDPIAYRSSESTETKNYFLLGTCSQHCPLNPIIQLTQNQNQKKKKKKKKNPTVSNLNNNHPFFSHVCSLDNSSAKPSPSRPKTPSPDGVPKLPEDQSQEPASPSNPVPTVLPLRMDPSR